MPEYKYAARDIRGKAHKGTCQAASEAELLARLKADGLFLIHCRQQAAADRGRKMAGKELCEMCRELGTMLSSGVTLLRAFEIMLRRDISKHHRAAYEGIYTALLSGTAMSDAMQQQGRVFPPLLVSMFRAGEANGTVDVTALRMADHYEKEYRLQNKVKSATTYPIILLILTVLIIIAVFTLVLPRFIALYKDRPLPAITRAVIGFSRIFTDHLAAVIFGAAVIIAIAALLLRLPAVGMSIDRLKLRLPVFGRHNRTIATARFARTLSSLYASGISILNALDIARGTMGNTYIARQFDTLIRDVRNGAPLSEALDKIDGFDKKLCATVAVGEESGRLEGMLLAVADSFDYEAAEAAQRMVTVLEPLCIVIMAAIIGTVVVAVLLPILDMYKTLDSADRVPAILGRGWRRL